ncbi:nitrogenase component 1 [Eubacterium oxidoreducens]|uniref:Nitrogenase molybdenum-iron protein beta chain n=1 Tax=Eubacterium oxidoreducens TaxID=1732 RepID=A0A1G6C2A7_EUBOX|nr:nitrogenase component 1 [Eubacterium oxidoreducens]SDB26994.1 nitrogenase molybdenum-iron protein beta chain [Eubacterium oxidoreducens]
MANNNGIIEQPRFSCAIGALQSVVAIKRAMPILHSGPGCGDMVQGFFERSRGYAGGDTSPCTNFSEKDVVFGGEEKLRKIIENSYKVLDTDLQVVMTGCTGGIVGDDIEGVVQEFQESKKPIVALDTPGFKCNNYVSHSHVVNAIIDQYVSVYEEDNPARSDKKLVNLFASIPYQDPFWKGNLREYKRLLEGLGLRVNVLFGPDSDGVKEWQTIPKANFNILVSPWYGKTIVDHLKVRYGQDYTWFHSVPIGANETEKFLRQVLSYAIEKKSGIDVKAAEEFIDRERDGYYEEIDNLATFLLEFRYGLPGFAHILHDSGYVVGMAKFLLHETGIVPKELFAIENTPEKYREAIYEDLKSTSTKRTIPLYFEQDAGYAQDIIRNTEHKGRGIILGSGWDKGLAREKNYEFLSVAVPSSVRLVLTTNYVGFSGGLRLIEDIYQTALNGYD